MTDKEAHEYAAKAAGIKVRWITNAQSAEQFSKMLWHWWAPKTNRADAFSLMVACKIDPMFGIEDTLGIEIVAVIYPINGGYESAQEPIGTDPEAATRLAIFHAAVEIGKAMK